MILGSGSTDTDVGRYLSSPRNISKSRILVPDSRSNEHNSSWRITELMSKLLVAYLIHIHFVLCHSDRIMT